MRITRRGLHGRAAMCLPIPAIQSRKEINQQRNLRIVKCVHSGCMVFGRLVGVAQRFALRRDGGALPRAPANFRLREARFADHFLIACLSCDGWASRWLSASRRWSCRPSQPRIGFANRLPGFRSDRTPLAHMMESARCSNTQQSQTDLAAQMTK